MSIWDGEIFFIVGTSRSGTTWLRNLLNADERILVGEESYFFDDVYPPLLSAYTKRRRPTGIQMYVDRQELHDAVASLFRALAGARAKRKPSAIIFGEKTPAHVRRIGEIKEVFPTSRIVHVVRDPRDVAASMLDAASSWARNDSMTLERAVSLWRAGTEAGLAAALRYPGDVLRVRYEDLHGAPVPTVTQVFQFLGIGIDQVKSQQLFENCRFELYTGGRKAGAPGGKGRFYRLGVVGGWRETFGQEEVALVEKVAGDLMRRLGYEASSPCE